MSEILILGGLYPENTEAEVIKKSRSSTLQFAASAHLKMIIDGIDKNIGGKYTLFNILPVGSYPKRYSDAFIKEYIFSVNGRKKHINAGYCNITVIKQLSKRHSLKKCVMRWAEKNRDKDFTVLVYSLEPEFITAAKALKDKYGCRICQLAADLPEYTDIDKGKNPIYRAASRYRAAKAARYIKNADSFVFLTKHMAERLGVGNKPYIVMEGLVPSGDVPPDTYGSDGKKYIVYTGSLTEKYGIMDLVNAFLTIDKDNYRLVICGSGEAEGKLGSIKDKRIIFKGAVSRGEAMDIQRKATVLVNPRSNNEEFTKYSFPSKIMEYMLSGRPVLCFKLDGIPDEYDSYLGYFPDSGSMAEEIVKYCEMPDAEIDKIGRKAREFVTANKNAVVQTRRILELMGFSEKELL